MVYPKSSRLAAPLSAAERDTLAPVPPQPDYDVLVAPWPELARPEEEAVATVLGQGRSVVVCGEPGAGKTTLVRRVSGALADSMPVEWLDPAMPPTAAPPTDDPLVVVVDDLHLIDDPTAARLVDQCRHGGTLLLSTMRTPSPRVMPRALQQLQHDDLLLRIDLPPLDATQVETLLTTALEGPVDGELVQEVVRLTRGNPLYVRETTRAAVASGTIHRVDRLWIWSGELGPDPRLTDLVAERLSRLEPELVPVLEFVAASEPVALATVVAAHSGPLVERLLDTGHLRVDSEGGQVVRSVNPLVGDAVRALIPPVRRQTLCEDLVRRWTTQRRDTPSGLVRWVGWALDSGVHVPAEVVVSAGVAARELGRGEVAITLLRDALDPARDPALPPAQQPAARAALGWELRYQGRLEEAYLETQFGEAALAAHPPAPDEYAALLVALGRLRADVEQFGHDDLAAALHTCDRVFGVASRRLKQPGYVERLALEIAVRRAWSGDVEPLMELVDVVLDDDAPDTDTNLNAVPPLVLAVGWRGETRRALTIAAEYAPWLTAHAKTSPLLPALHAYVAFMVMLHAGDDVSSLWFAPSVGTATHPVSRQEHGFAQSWRGRSLLASGRWEAARQAFRVAHQIYALRDTMGVLGWSLAGEAFTTMMTGDRRRATELLRSARRTRIGASRMGAADSDILLALTAIGVGEPDAADRARHTAVWAAEQGYPVTELEAWNAVALADPEAARAAGALARAQHLMTQTDAPVAPAIVRHLEAVLADDATLAAAARKDLATHGRWLPTPGAPTTLSRREQEVAALAASGLPTRMIAERLYLSERTVESHLSRVFAKLGIHRRAELAEALNQRS